MTWILTLDRDQIVASQAEASAAKLRLALSRWECQLSPCGYSQRTDQAAAGTGDTYFGIQHRSARDRRCFDYTADRKGQIMEAFYWFGGDGWRALTLESSAADLPEEYGPWRPFKLVVAREDAEEPLKRQGYWLTREASDA